MHTDAAQSDPAAAPRKDFVRGIDVLPPDLIGAIQSHVAGCFVYIPSVVPRARAGRDKQVIEARAGGATLRSLAAQFDLTERRICQILARHRAGSELP